jgi:hypothetical protein
MVLSLLRETKYQTHPRTEDLIQHTAEIFGAFLDHPKSSKSAFSWANDIMKKKYANDVRELSHKDNGWHFGALKTSEEQLTNFQIEDMAHDMARLAPEPLWQQWRQCLYHGKGLLPPLGFANGKVGTQII